MVVNKSVIMFRLMPPVSNAPLFVLQHNIAQPVAFPAAQQQGLQ
jgi:hypothetical protein